MLQYTYDREDGKAGKVKNEGLTAGLLMLQFPHQGDRNGCKV
jgi:hypothetical protein